MTDRCVCLHLQQLHTPDSLGDNGRCIHHGCDCIALTLLQFVGLHP